MISEKVYEICIPLISKKFIWNPYGEPRFCAYRTPAHSDALIIQVMLFEGLVEYFKVEIYFIPQLALVNAFRLTPKGEALFKPLLL